MDDRSIIVTVIAKACHEANRAYCESFGDHSQVAWEDAPEWQRVSCIEGVRGILKNPDRTPEESHNAWMEHKKADGWVYGPVKDAQAKTHPNMVPYHHVSMLNKDRAKDCIFLAIVRSLACLVS